MEDHVHLISKILSDILLKLDPDKDMVIVNNSDDVNNIRRAVKISNEDNSLGFTFAHVMSFIAKDSLIEYKKIDLESIVKQKIKNIFLIDFDKMTPDFLSYLITCKSKKSEIIGISTNHTDYFKNLQLKIQKYKDKRFTNDQIYVMSILEDNSPPEMIQACLNNFRFKKSNIKIQEIEYFSDVEQFIK